MLRGIPRVLELALAVAVLVPSALGQEAALVLRGAKVHAKPGVVLENADVLVEHGLIKGVGEKLTVPEGATIVDLAGQDLWPAFIDPLNDALLEPDHRARGTFGPADRTVDAYDPFRATDNTAMLRAGVGAVGLGTWPQGIRGGVISVLEVAEAPGEPAFLGKDQIVLAEMGTQGRDEPAAPDGMPRGRGRRPQFQDFPFQGAPALLSTSLVTREAQARAVDELVEGGRRYKEAWEKYEKDFEEYKKKLEEWEKSKGTGSRPASRPAPSDTESKPPERPTGQGFPPDFRNWPREKRQQWLRENMGRAPAEGARPTADTSSAPSTDGKPKPPEKPRTEPAKDALIAVLKRERPLWVAAHWVQDIEAALDLAKAKKIRIALMGASEAWRALDRVKKEHVTVLLRSPGVADADSLDRIAEPDDLCARLSRAGVPVAFCTAGDSRVGAAGAALAAATGIGRGMSEDAALAAVTVNAARVLGLEKKLGTIEVGKTANLFATHGSPFAPSASATTTVSGGKLRSWETK